VRGGRGFFSFVLKAELAPGGEIKQIRQMFQQNSPPNDRCGDGKLARTVFYILSGRCGDHNGQTTFFVDPCGIRYRESDFPSLVIPSFGGSGGVVSSPSGGSGTVPKVVKPRVPPPQVPSREGRDLRNALRAIADNRELKSARPQILKNLLFLMQGKYATQGIFRLSGQAQRVAALVVAAHKTTGDQQADLLNQFPDVHDATNALKLYLREMPTRLFAGMWAAHGGPGGCFQTNQVEPAKCEQQITASIVSLDLSFKAILGAYLEVWKLTKASAATNLMAASNLAVVFSPNLFPETTDPMKALSELPVRGAVATFIIENVPQ
jgi:hypothetical protein